MGYSANARCCSPIFSHVFSERHCCGLKILVILLPSLTPSFILDDMSTRIDELEKNIGDILNSQDGE